PAPLQRMPSLRPEAVGSQRSQDATIKQSPLQDLAVQLASRRNVTHEAAGKRITRPSRILYFLDRQRRRAKRMPADAEGTLTKENRRSILAVLDHQSLRP